MSEHENRQFVEQAYAIFTAVGGAAHPQIFHTIYRFIAPADRDTNEDTAAASR